MRHTVIPTPDEIFTNYQVDVAKAQSSSSLIFLVEDSAHQQLIKRSIVDRNIVCFIVGGRENVNQCLMMFRVRSGLSVRGLIDDDSRGWAGIENKDLIFKTDYWDVESSVLMTSIFEKFTKDYLPGYQLDPDLFLDQVINAAVKIGKFRMAALDTNYAAKFRDIKLSEYTEVRSTLNDTDHCLTFDVSVMENRLETLISPVKSDAAGKVEFEKRLKELQTQISRGKIERKKLCHGKDMLEIIRICGSAVLQAQNMAEPKTILYPLFSPHLLGELTFLRDMDVAASEF